MKKTSPTKKLPIVTNMWVVFATIVSRTLSNNWEKMLAHWLLGRSSVPTFRSCKQ